MLGVLGRKKNKNTKENPLQNSNKKVPRLDNWPAKHSHTSWRRKRKEKEKKMKRTPIKRHKHLVHLNKPFLTGPSREQFNQDLSVVSLCYSEWDHIDF